MTTQTIKEAIKALLIDGAGLTDIKKWFNSEPNPTKYTGLFGFVEWVGGPVIPEAGTKKLVDVYSIVIAKKSANSEDNESAIIAYCMAAEAILDANPTLSGTSLDSWVSNREIQKVYSGDYEICAVKITLSTWRYA